MKKLYCKLLIISICFSLFECATINKYEEYKYEYGPPISEVKEKQIGSEYTISTEINKRNLIIKLNEISNFQKYVKKKANKYLITKRTAKFGGEEYDGPWLGIAYCLSFLYIIPIIAYPIDVIRQVDSKELINEEVEEVEAGDTSQQVIPVEKAKIQISVNDKTYKKGKTDKDGLIKLNLNKLIKYCISKGSFVVTINAESKEEILNIDNYSEVMNHPVYSKFITKREKNREKVNSYLEAIRPYGIDSLKKCNKLKKKLISLAKKNKNDEELFSEIQTKIQSLEWRIAGIKDEKKRAAEKILHKGKYYHIEKGYTDALVINAPSSKSAINALVGGLKVYHNKIKKLARTVYGRGTKVKIEYLGKKYTKNKKDMRVEFSILAVDKFGSVRGGNEYMNYFTDFVRKGKYWTTRLNLNSTVKY